MSDSNARRVLIVEDDPSNSELETLVLGRNGMLACAVTTGAAAIEKLKQERFLAVLLDYHLADGLCWPVLEAARQSDTHLPVIMVTGLGDERVAVEAMHRGATDYVIKGEQLWKQLPEIIKRAIKQHETERDLEESNLRLHAAIQASNTGLWDWNIQTNEVVYSREWKSQLGYEENEIANHFSEWRDRLHPDDRERALTQLAVYLKGDAPAYEFEYRLLHKDGLYRWILTRGTILRDAVGKPVRMLGSHADITDRKKAEEAQVESERRHKDLLDNVLDLIHSVTPDGRFDYVNRAWRETLGYTETELGGLAFFDVIHPACHAHCKELFQRVMKGEVLRNVEVTFVAKDGREIIAEGSSSCSMKDGVPQFMRGIFRDITERKRAEKEKAELENQHRQTQKIASIGRLTGGIAHDFNNLLTVIIGHSELLLARLGSDDKNTRQLELIHKTAKRAADLIRQLLAFSRQQLLLPSVLNFNDIISEIETMLRRLVREDIAIALTLAPKARLISADRGQLEQVILNLVVNASDAMPHGGKIIIETANVDLDDAYEKAHPYVQAGSFLMFSVTDTGSGIAPAIKARIFDPYFTTKEVGKGTGLGLSTVYGIVKQSGGHIEVYSELGIGTTFKIYLPVVSGDAKASSLGLQHATVARGNETILLVEDDESVRGLVRDVLTECGYSVLIASNGDEALRFASDYQEHIHILVSDIVMPKISGAELAEHVRKLRPAIKCLFMSGYTEQSVYQTALLEKGAAFIQKPFATDAFSRKVREVLGPAVG